MRLLYLYVENFMAYARQRIDFDESGCFVITGENLDRGGKSNGSGKSSIFWGITMALYNQARGKTLGESIKIGAKSCVLEIALVSGDKYYKITRKRKREGTSTTFLWVADNPDFKNPKDITGNDQNETQLKINDIMKMDYQSFCHSMYFKEDASSIFAQSTKSVRFNIIKNSLQVDRYDRYAKEAKKDLEETMARLSELSGFISNGELLEKELEDNIEMSMGLAGKAQSLKLILVDIDSRVSTIQSERASCEIDLAAIRSADKQKLEMINVISEMDRQINQTKAQIKKYGDEVTEYRRNLGLIKNEIDALNGDRNKITILSSDDIDGLKESLNNTQVQISLNLSKIQEMKEKIKILKSATGSQCWACNKQLHANESKALISEAQSVISISETANVTLEESKKNIQMAIAKANSNANLVSAIDSKLSKLEAKAGTAMELCTKAKSILGTLDCSEVETNKKQYLLKIEDLSNNIETLKTRVKSSIDRRESIDREEKQLLLQKNSIMSDIAETNQKLGELKHRSGEIKQILDDIDSKKAEVAQLWNRRTVVENFVSACSKKGGIPSILISQAIVEIEKFANDTLYKFDDIDGMNIKMSMDKPDEIEISVRMGSEVDYRDFDTFSGGERFIISFAIRMALARVLSKKYGADIKFILLDEAGTALDEYNTTRFAQMVKNLSKDSLILLITHQNNLRDFIQQNILVRRSGGKSSIFMNTPGAAEGAA